MRLASVFGLFFAIVFAIPAFAVSPEIVYENASNSPIFKLIQSAKSSIDIEIYEVEDTKVHRAILKAMDRGVRVRVVQESEAVGSACQVFQPARADESPACLAQKNFVAQVKARGGKYVPFAFDQFCKADRYRCLEHGKLMLVDGAKALISTGNFNASNLCDPNGKPTGVTSQFVNGVFETCNRDYTVVSTDQKVVKTLVDIFESDLKGTAYNLREILKESPSQKLTVSPYSLDPLVAFIRSAKKTIQIENQYLKNGDLNAELIAAAKRGVRVFVVVNSACAFGAPTQFDVDQWKQIFGAFDQAGIQTRTFTRKIKVGGFSGYLHSKAVIVDSKRAWIGSVNGSTQALTRNREFGIFIDDAEQVSILGQFLYADFKDPNTQSWRDSLQCKKEYE